MDCLDGIQGVETNSVKLIVTDPPYFLGMTHNGQQGSFVDLAICKPFYKQLFNEYKRVLKPDGEVYFFTDWRGYAFYYPLFDAILGARNVIVWDKVSGPGSFYSYQHEFILFHCVQNTTTKKGGNVWRSPGFGGGQKLRTGPRCTLRRRPSRSSRRSWWRTASRGTWYWTPSEVQEPLRSCVERAAAITSSSSSTSTTGTCPRVEQPGQYNVPCST